MLSHPPKFRQEEPAGGGRCAGRRAAQSACARRMQLSDSGQDTRVHLLYSKHDKTSSLLASSSQDSSAMTCIVTVNCVIIKHTCSQQSLLSAASLNFQFNVKYERGQDFDGCRRRLPLESVLTLLTCRWATSIRGPCVHPQLCQLRC